MNVLRLYINVAWTNKKPLPMLNCHTVDQYCSDRQDPWLWVYGITFHVARCLTYCYGDEPQSDERWAELMAYTDKWMEEKPQAFHPLYRQELETGQGFPTILFASDAHGEPFV